MTRVRSLQKVKVRGQISRSQGSQTNLTVSYSFFIQHLCLIHRLCSSLAWHWCQCIHAHIIDSDAPVHSTLIVTQQCTLNSRAFIGPLFLCKAFDKHIDWSISLSEIAFARNTLIDTIAVTEFAKRKVVSTIVTMKSNLYITACQTSMNFNLDKKLCFRRIHLKILCTSFGHLVRLSVCWGPVTGLESSRQYAIFYAAMITYTEKL